MGPKDFISMIISLFALAISLYTLWLSRWRKGIVKMTRPTVICFVPKNGGDNPKIFLRTLLYNTSERGQYIQNMFVQLEKDGLIMSFNVWAYGDKGIVRGSGLFVDKTGFESYHHFLLPKTDTEYNFSRGEYSLTVFVESVNSKPKRIFGYTLTLKDSQPGDNAAIYFDWDADKQYYYPNLDIGRGLPNLT